MKKLILAAVITMTASGAAFANQCPRLMAEIDEAMMSAAVDDATKVRIAELYEKGKAAHEAGDHDASVADLNEALKLLGL